MPSFPLMLLLCSNTYRLWSKHPVKPAHLMWCLPLKPTRHFIRSDLLVEGWTPFYIQSFLNAINTTSFARNIIDFGP